LARVSEQVEAQMGASPIGFKFPEVIHSTHDVAGQQGVP
jgi:hypothetical protein